MFDVTKAFASISSAPFDGNWADALAQISAAGGGWAGQLVGVSRAGEVLYNFGHRVSFELLEDFERRGGVDPRLNPRARILERRFFQTFGDNELMSADEQRRDPFYAELFVPADSPFVCISRLPGPRGASVGVVALRSASAGHVTDEERLQFSMLLPHVAAAIRLQAKLEGYGRSVALGALEAVAMPAFLLSATGRLVALTTAAEAVVAEAGILRLRGRKIDAVDRRSNERLQAAIRLACGWRVDQMVPHSRSVVLRGETLTTTAEVAPLPCAWGPTRHGAVAVLTVPLLRRPGEPFVAEGACAPAVKA